MSRHAAAPATSPILRSLVRRRAPRHAAVSMRPGLVASTVPLMVLTVVVLLLLAIGTGSSAKAAPTADTAEYAVRLTLVEPTPLTTVAPAPTASPAAAGTPRIEEDDPAFDCKTMGNHACGETRTDVRFPGVSFHYVTTYDAAGAPLHTYTLRQYQALTGAALAVSTATDRY